MLLNKKKVQIKNGQLISLRSPKPIEAENLLKHLRIVFHESYRNMNYAADYFDSFSTETESKILEDFSISKEKFMLSAFIDDRIVGNLGIFGMGGDFLKYTARLGMGIEKSFHNLGIGSAMIRYALESAKEIGFHRVELTVRTYNDSGISLYEKSGFERIGLLKETAFIDGKYVDEYAYQIIF